MKKYLKLFACCIPVKGASISIICDLQRSSFHYIPNELYEILIQEPHILLETLLEQYPEEERETLMEYFNFLVDEEYAMLTNSPDSFPAIDNNYITPELINNAIIDFSDKSNHALEKLIPSLDDLGCKHLELRFFSHASLDFICDEVLSHFDDTRIRSITLYLKYSKELTKENIHARVIKRYPFVLNIIVHAAPSNEQYEDIKYRSIVYISDIISSEKHCGLIRFEYFSINYSTFFESLKYNSCLNKKIAIDSNGLIKNCPSVSKSYGSHRTIDIKDVAKSSEFQSIWNISKDQVQICKDCQFRYICTDCRAYIESPTDIYSKPLKCGYSPYTNEWEHWSSLDHKQDAILKYELHQENKK